MPLTLTIDYNQGLEFANVNFCMRRTIASPMPYNKLIQYSLLMQRRVVMQDPYFMVDPINSACPVAAVWEAESTLNGAETFGSTR